MPPIRPATTVRIGARDAASADGDGHRAATAALAVLAKDPRRHRRRPSPVGLYDARRDVRRYGERSTSVSKLGVARNPPTAGTAAMALHVLAGAIYGMLRQIGD